MAKTVTLRIMILALLVLCGAGCQALREIANLRNVVFSIDQATDLRLADVPLDRIRTYEELRAGDLLRLGAAVADRRLPFDFVLHLRAENPSENNVQARMVQLDWTLLLDDQETVSGLMDQPVLLPPGEPQDVPLTISVDLVQFFDQSARDLIELALAVSGQGGAPKRIKLQATPTIDTALGPIRYPNPITIVSREVGQ